MVSDVKHTFSVFMKHSFCFACYNKEAMPIAGASVLWCEPIDGVLGVFSSN